MKHALPVTIFLVLLFLAAQYIGLFVLDRYIDVEKTQATGVVEFKELPSVGPVQIERPKVEPQVSFWYILAAILIGTVLILIIIKLNVQLLWKLWFFAAVVITLTIALGAFMTGWVAFVVSLVLTWFKIFRPNVYLHNFTELLVYGGLAVIFVPILNVPVMLLLLVVLSFYDMYAVWKSEHMIKMAKFQAQSGIFAGMLIPYELPKTIPKGARVVKKNVHTAVLGGGDIGFPLMFAGTVMKMLGFASALVIPLFAGAALLGLLYFGQQKKFYPAMPFLTIGCVIGFLLVWLL